MSGLQLLISSHISDTDIVRTIMDCLQAADVTLIVDPSDPDYDPVWPRTLAKRLDEASALAVCLGPHRLSPRQKQLLGLAREHQTQVEATGRHFPVIPVLLPQADLAPAFLFSEHWLDLRRVTLDRAALEPLVQAARGLADKRPQAVIVDHCPFRSLKTFREEDAAFFFGREALVSRLLERVQRQPLVTLLGPTGSGKSSVIQAGLLPRLRRHCSPDGWWELVYLSPGERPFDRLAAGLSDLMEPSPDSPNRFNLAERLAGRPAALADVVNDVLAARQGQARLLVIIDPFEELLTLTPAAERAAFVEALQIALEQSSLSLLLACPTEDYSRIAALNETFARRLEGSLVHLGPLKPEALKQACAGPARLVTTALEPELLDHLKTSQRPLALIEFSLGELWRRHRGGLLTWTDFETIGGVEGALDQRAEALYKALSPHLRRRTRQIFRSLVQIDERGEVAGLPRVGLSDLCSVDDKLGLSQVRQVIATLAEGGLLTIEQDEFTGQDRIGITNPVVINRWSRLRAWLDREREFRLWRQRLTRSVAAWERANRRTRLLLGRAALTEAEGWLTTRSEQLLPIEQAFIRQSSNHRRRAQASGWIVGLAAAAVLLWTLVAVTIQRNVAYRSMRDQRDVALTGQADIERALASARAAQATAEAARELAGQQQQQALAGQLAAQSRLVLNDMKGDLTQSMLLAVESLRRAPALETEQLLHEGLTRLPRFTARLSHTDEVWTAVFSPDGQWLATRSGPVARIWTVPSGEPRVQLKHDGYLNDMDVGPDSQWLATATMDNTAHLWDVATGREVARLRHDERVWEVSFSPDGQWLATRSDRTAYVWRLTPGAIGPVTIGENEEKIRSNINLSLLPQPVENGEPLPETVTTVIGRGMLRMAHPENILDMALSPDGRWLATAGSDHIARVWEVTTGREMVRLTHDDEVRSLAFSRDSRLLVTGGADHTARVWPLELDTVTEAAEPVTLTVPGSRLMHPEIVDLVTFSPDGRWLVTVSRDYTARIWLLVVSNENDGPTITAREVARVAHDDRIWAVKFNPDSRWLVTASADHTARVWLTTTGRPLAQMAHLDQIVDVAFSPDGRWLATASSDRTAQLWQSTIGYEVAEMEHDDWVLSVAFSPDGRTLATRSGKTAQLWEAGTGAELARHEHDTYVNTVAYSPDGRWFATGNYRAVRVWAADTGEEVARMRHGGLVRTMAFSPDGRWLATAGIERMARVWEVATGREVVRLNHTNWINAVTFSPDGRWLATASDDDTARVWDVTTGQEVARLPHEKVVNQVAFSPDSQWLATASGDRTVRIWEATSVREVARLEHQGTVLGVAFSPDGRWLATRSRQIVQIWDTSAYEKIARLEHAGVVESFAFSPDSRRLATASGDRTALVLDIATGQEIARLNHEYWVNAVDFSPDGRWLATASADRTARVWLLEQEDLLAEVCARLPFNLTGEEWRQYLSGERYRATCPGLPVPGD